MGKALAISALALGMLTAGNALGGQCKKITFNCSNGGAKAQIDGGEEFTINCGASTQSKSGKIEKKHQCVGSSFPCMKGKDCIEMDGAKKFHMTNCGSGGQPAQGNLSTAGCITMDTNDFKKLEDCQGAEYTVQANGGGGTGR